MSDFHVLLCDEERLNRPLELSLPYLHLIYTHAHRNEIRIVSLEPVYSPIMWL